MEADIKKKTPEWALFMTAVGIMMRVIDVSAWQMTDVIKYCNDPIIIENM